MTEKDLYLENIVKSCLKEAIEEYTEVPYSDWNNHSNSISDTYRKWYGSNGENKDVHPTFGIKPGNGGLPMTTNGDMIIYHACQPEAVDGILKNGFSRRYTGQRANCVGTGIYCTLTPTYGTYGSEFGHSLLKCILVGGLKDFIIFSQELRDKYDNGASLEDEFRRTIKDPEKIREIFNRFNPNNYRGSSSRSSATHLVDTLSGEKFLRHHDANLRIPDASSDLRDESLLNSTGIRGFVYQDYYSDNTSSAVILVRDINSIIPYQYKMERKSDHWHYAIRDEETFNRINNNTDVYWQHSGKYPKTHYYATQSCGYAVVADNKGKYYVDRKGNSIFNVPLDDATMIDPETKEGQFTYKGNNYVLMLKGDRKLVRKIGPNGKPIGLPMPAEKIGV